MQFNRTLIAAISLCIPLALAACGDGTQAPPQAAIAVPVQTSTQPARLDEAPRAAAAVPMQNQVQPAEASEATLAFDSAPAVGAKAICPVMGGSFEVEEGTKTSEHQGKHYAFCCPGCKPKFDANPGDYLK